MNTDLLPVEPYYGDLWSCPRTTLTTAVRGVVEQRGLILMWVNGLGSGLWITCRVYDPSDGLVASAKNLTIPQADIKAWVFAELDRRKQLR